jgi:hypothetical protein
MAFNGRQIHHSRQGSIGELRPAQIFHQEVQVHELCPETLQVRVSRELYLMSCSSTMLPNSNRNDGVNSFPPHCNTPHSTIYDGCPRWGFRQVEKDFSSGVMIFMHKHFTRGDKKKCLTMHSIVNAKKPPASSIVAMNVSSNRRRDNIRVPNAGDTANHLLQNNRHAIYGGDNSFLSYSGQGGTYNMLDGRVNPGLSMTYGLSMQMYMPHSNYLNNVSNWTIPGLANNRSQVAQRPSLTATVAAALHANQGYSTAVPVSQPSAGISNIGRPAEEVNLAALIMNEDPTIDAWQALQLAKRRLNGTLTSSNPT